MKDKKRLTRTYEDKPRTDLGHAEDKKGLAKGSHLGKVQFYPKNFIGITILLFRKWLIPLNLYSANYYVFRNLSMIPYINKIQISKFANF